MTIDWTQVLTTLLTLLGVCLSVFVNYRLGKVNQEAKDRAEKRQVQTTSDESFRDDLLQTIRQQSEAIRDADKTRVELQNTIDAERARRRMHESENDHLVRQISKLQIEKEQLLNRMNELEHRITQLEEKLLSQENHS